MGMMPVSECSRRRKNERPCPARNGATPPLTVVLVELGADAKPSLNSLEKITEPFIMLAGNGPSQGRQFSRLSCVRRKTRFSLRESDDGVLLRRNRAERVRQYRPIRMIEAGADLGRSRARVAVQGQFNVFSRATELGCNILGPDSRIWYCEKIAQLGFGMRPIIGTSAHRLHVILKTRMSQKPNVIIAGGFLVDERRCGSR